MDTEKEYVVSEIGTDTGCSVIIKRLTWWQRQFIALFLGQCLSLCLTSCGVTSQSLATFYNVDIPTTQSFLNYLLLGLIYSIVAIVGNRKQFWISFKERWWILFIIGIVDVEANYTVVSAYQYTTITSVMVLDCFTIPCVMLLSFFILKERFGFVHVLAVIVCIIGLITLIFSDAIQQQSEGGGSKQVLGDLLVLLACVLYSISNVGQQYQVERHSNIEFLAMLGIFGSIVSFIQMMILELDALKTIEWNWEIVTLIVAFALSLFLLYSTTPFLLQLSSATLMNISFLTADAYSLIAGIVIFDYVPSILYFLSLAITITGLIIYNLKPSTKALAIEKSKVEIQDDVEEKSVE